MKNLMMSGMLLGTLFVGMNAFAGGGGDYNNPCLDGGSVPGGSTCPNEKHTLYTCGPLAGGDLVGNVKEITLHLRQSTISEKIERLAFIVGNYPGIYRNTYVRTPQRIASHTYWVNSILSNWTPAHDFNLRIQILEGKQSARISGTSNGLPLDQTVACKVKVF
ncbi:MAG: hypothetical protein V4736_15075 [Bdellovibrionota bacterium]